MKFHILQNIESIKLRHKDFSKIWLIIPVLLLFSGTAYAQSNGMPSEFASSPLESFNLSTPTGFDRIESVRAESSYTERYSDGNPGTLDVYKIVTAEKRLANLNGEYTAPYYVKEDANMVMVETPEGSFVWNKSACAITFYNGELITQNSVPVIGSDSFIFRGAVVGSDNWNNLPALNNASCVTEIFEDGTNIEVRGTKTAPGVGEAKIRYIKLAGDLLKPQLEVTNLNPAWTNHKLSILETLHVPDNVKLGDTVYNIEANTGFFADRTWIQQRSAQFIELTDKVNYDVGLGWDLLWGINVVYENSTSKLVFDYSNNELVIAPNETLILDPLYGVDTTSPVSANVNGAGDECLQFGASVSNIHSWVWWESEDPFGANGCMVGVLEYDVSTIPDFATISDINVRITTSSVTVDGTTDIRQYNSTTRPTTVANTSPNALVMFNEIRNSTAIYHDDFVITHPSTNVDIDLSPTSYTDLETILQSGQNWVAYGFIKGNHTDRVVTTEVVLASSQLEITYTLPVPTTPTTEITVDNPTSKTVTSTNSTTPVGNILGTYFNRVDITSSCEEPEPYNVTCPGLVSHLPLDGLATGLQERILGNFTFQDKATLFYGFDDTQRTNYGGKFVTSISSIAEGDSTPRDVGWGKNGTKLYTVHTSGADEVDEWDCTSAYTLSSCTNINSPLAVSLIPTSVKWKSDGTKVLVHETNNNQVREFTCTTDWDISSCSQVDTLNHGENLGEDIDTNDDGTKLYVGDVGNDNIREWDCSTGFDLSTCTDAVSPLSMGANFEAFAFVDSKDTLFATYASSNQLKQFDCSVEDDLSSCVLNTSETITLPVTITNGIGFGDDTLVLLDSSDNIQQFRLTGISNQATLSNYSPIVTFSDDFTGSDTWGDAHASSGVNITSDVIDITFGTDSTNESVIYDLGSSVDGDFTFRTKANFDTLTADNNGVAYFGLFASDQSANSNTVQDSIALKFLHASGVKGYSSSVSDGVAPLSGTSSTVTSYTFLTGTDYYFELTQMNNTSCVNVFTDSAYNSPIGNMSCQTIARGNYTGLQYVGFKNAFLTQIGNIAGTIDNVNVYDGFGVLGASADGIIYGATTTSVPGIRDQAYDFDGISDVVDGGINFHPYNADPFTISAWINFGNMTSGNDAIIMGNMDASSNCNAVANGCTNGGWALFQNDADDLIHFIIADDVTPESSKGTRHLNNDMVLDKGIWYHFVVTKESNPIPDLGQKYIKMYVNGVLQGPLGSGGANNGPDEIHKTAGNLNWEIGNGADRGTFFEGQIDDVLIFSSVLSSHQVQQLYNGGDSIDANLLFNSTEYTVPPTMTLEPRSQFPTTKGTVHFDALDTIPTVTFLEDYANATNIEQTGTTIDVSGGTATFTATPENSDDRLTQRLGFTLSDESVTIRFKTNISNSSLSNFWLMAVADDGPVPQLYPVGTRILTENLDAIGVGNNGTNLWLGYADGGTVIGTNVTQSISYSTDYWIEVTRKNHERSLNCAYGGGCSVNPVNGLLTMNIYTDSNFTTLHGTRAMNIPDTVTGLTTIQHAAWGSTGDGDTMTGIVDDVAIYNGWDGHLSKIGGSIYFDGYTFYSTEDEIEPTIDFSNTDPFSLSYWINIDPRTTLCQPITPPYDDCTVVPINKEFALLGYESTIDKDGYARFILMGGEPHSNPGSPPVAPESINVTALGTKVWSDSDTGVWKHIVNTYDGSSLASGANIYINGINQTLTVYEDTLNSTIQNLPDRRPNLQLGMGTRDASWFGFVGNCPYECFIGSLDEVRIYDTELTPQQVSTLYSYNTILNSTTLVDTTVNPSNVYEYKSANINQNGQSVWSFSGSSLNFTVPTEPLSLVVTSASTTELGLSWTPPTEDGNQPITGYKIERESPIGGGFTTILADTGNNNTSYNNTNVNSTALKAYYQFEETTGNLLNKATDIGSTDSWGSFADCSVFGATRSQSGLINDSYSFDGINDYCEAASKVAQVGSITYPFTLNIWVNMTDVDNGGIAFGLFGESHSPQYSISVVSTASELFPKIAARWPNNNSHQYTGTNNFAAGEWHMLTGVFINSTSKNLYLDGILQGGFTDSVSYYNLTDDIGIGRAVDGSPGGEIKGKLDEASIWDRELTTNEIIRLYNVGLGDELPIESVLSATQYNYKVSAINSIGISDSSTTGTVEYLVVAGGAGGGGVTSNARSAGGGGAGGFITGTNHTVFTQEYPIIVGDGGLGGVQGSEQGKPGGFSSFDIFNATGGGGGGGNGGNSTGANGGSGGGGVGVGSNNGGHGILGQGFDGGAGYGGANPWGGGGGGGASGVGLDAVSPNGGDGGNGTQSAINGTLIYYAGGGGGGICEPGCFGDNPGAGGLGGGGDGGQDVAGEDAVPNTGGGGGGAQITPGIVSGGDGGSGIVIISYPTDSFAATGGTITYSGGNTIHTFTSSESFFVLGTSYNWTQPEPPISPSAIPVTNVADQINLEWTAPNGTINGYIIEYETPIGNGFVVLEANYTDGATVDINSGSSLISTTDTGALSSPTTEAPVGIWFKPDGTRMFIVQLLDEAIEEFELSDPWNVTSATYTDTYDASSEFVFGAWSLYIKPDGTSWYAHDVGANVVREFSMSAWDISTSSPVPANDYSPSDTSYAISFKPDGTKMYLTASLCGPCLGNYGISEYDLSSSWDASTASLNQTYTFPLAASSYGVFWDSDGSKLFVSADEAPSDIFEYSLSIPWDISTLTQVQNFTASDLGMPVESSGIGGIFIKPDNKKMYLQDIDDTVPINNVWEFLLLTTVYYNHTGLTENTTYNYRIASITNPVGPYSPPFNATTGDAPDPPTSVTTSIVDPDLDPLNVLVSWVAPIDIGDNTVITGYDIIRSVNLGPYTSLVNDTAGLTYNDLTVLINTNYTYAVSAKGDVINGNFSGPSNTILTANVPDITTGVSASVPVPAVPYEISISWSTPGNGGSIITGYTLWRSLDNITFANITATANSPYLDTVPSVPDETYYYKIQAKNILGYGANSTAIQQTVASVPNAPTGVTPIVPVPSLPYEISVSWSAPVDDGGSPLQTYTIWRSIDDITFANITATGNVTSYSDTVPSVPGENYYYKIQAKNNLGYGVNSTSNNVTVANVPSVPLSLTVLPGADHTSMKLDWVTPTSDGGSPITGYQIQININDAGWTTLIANTGNIDTEYTDIGRSINNNYKYSVYAINALGGSSGSSVAQGEFTTAVLTPIVTPMIGNTIRFDLNVNMTYGIPNSEIYDVELHLWGPNTLVQQVEPEPSDFIAKNNAINYTMYHNVNELTEYYMVVKTVNGEMGEFTIFQTGKLTAIPTLSYDSNIIGVEYRNESYNASNLQIVGAPANFDLVVVYREFNDLDNEIILTWEDVIEDVTDTIAVDPTKKYYISAYYEPTFNYTISGSPIDGNATIPIGYPVDVSLISIPDPNQVGFSLGIDAIAGESGIFGLPLVFIFIIALASIFTGRSAPMGIIFIAVALGFMAYMGLVDFNFDPANDSNTATWAIIIVAVIIGVMVGKRWD